MRDSIGHARKSSLPDPIIAALLGVSSDDVWDIRNRGVIPPERSRRVRAFTDAVESRAVATDQDSGEGDE